MVSAMLSAIVVGVDRCR